MPITTQSIRDPMPTGALRGALQSDGTVLWYMPGDALPHDPPVGPDAPPPKTAEEKLAEAREVLAVVETLPAPVFTADVVDILTDLRAALED